MHTQAAALVGVSCAQGSCDAAHLLVGLELEAVLGFERLVVEQAHAGLAAAPGAAGVRRLHYDCVAAGGGLRAAPQASAKALHCHPRSRLGGACCGQDCRATALAQQLPVADGHSRTGVELGYVQQSGRHCRSGSGAIDRRRTWWAMRRGCSPRGTVWMCSFLTSSMVPVHHSLHHDTCQQRTMPA